MLTLVAVVAFVCIGLCLLEAAETAIPRAVARFEAFLDRGIARRRARARQHTADPILAAHNGATTRLSRQENRT